MPEGIAYLGQRPAGLEVIHRDDERQQWLVAWFEDERLRIGVLKLDANPWTLTRLSEKSDLAPFLANLAG